MKEPKITPVEPIDLPKMMEHFHPHAGKRFSYHISPPVILERTMTQIQGYIQGSEPMHVLVTFETNNRRQVTGLKVDCRPESPEWDERRMQMWVDENIVKLIKRFTEQFQDKVLTLLEPHLPTKRTDPWP